MKVKKNSPLNNDTATWEKTLVSLYTQKLTQSESDKDVRAKSVSRENIGGNL